MKKAIMAILLILVVAVLFTACGGDATPPEQKKPEVDTWKTIDNADESDVYTELIKGIKNSLNDLSETKLKKNPILSIDTKMKMQFNEHLYWLTFKLNYNYTKESETKFALEIADEEETSIILGAYFIDNFVYIKIMDGDVGELKFPLKNSVVGDLLPANFSDINVVNTSQIINSLITVDGKMTGKYRLNGSIPEYQYTFNINLPSTLTKIVGLMEDDGLLDGFDTESLSTIIERLIGITFEDVKNNNMPDSSVVVNFSTSNSKLATFKLDLEVEPGDGTQNTLFGGDVINFSLDLAKLTLDTKYTTIDFLGTNEYKTYPNYLDQSFGVILNIIEKGETSEEDTPYFLKGEIKVDIEEIENNELLLEILDINKDPVAGFYIYKNNLSIYGIVDGVYGYRTDFPIDIIDIFEKISEKDLLPDESKKTAMEYIAYLIGAFRLSDEKISFTINEDFYNVLLPNFCQIIAYIDEAIEDIDLQEELNTAGIDIVGYLMQNVYVISIDLAKDAENFIYVLDGSIDFPADVTAEKSTPPEVD